MTAGPSRNLSQSGQGAPAGAPRRPDLDQDRTERATRGSFYDSLRITLKWEGGYSNDPDDPGGATMRGVIQRVYNGFRASQGLGYQHVRSISNSELQTIYRQNYWNAAGCESLPTRIATVHFDTAVNCGIGGASRVMQRALQIAGLNRDQLSNLSGDQETAFLIAHTQARMERYEAICARWEARGKNNPYKFLNGWANRTCDVAKFVGVPESALSKIFDSRVMARASGTARDWGFPAGFSEGMASVLFSFAPGLSSLGGNAIRFFSGIFSNPKVDLDLGEPEPPPVQTAKALDDEDIPGEEPREEATERQERGGSGVPIGAAGTPQSAREQILDRRRTRDRDALERYYQELRERGSRKAHSEDEEGRDATPPSTPRPASAS